MAAGLSTTVRFGPVAAPGGAALLRSGIRWLRGEGEPCGPGEVFAFCNLGFAGAGATGFAEEARDLQAGFACATGGRLRRAAGLSRGGDVDRLNTSEIWRPEAVLATVEAEGAGPGEQAAELLMFAGRRVAELAELRSGLLTGWHDRVRAWRGDGSEAGGLGTLIGLGTCEQEGILRGDSHAFLELFGAASETLHVVLLRDEPLLPSAPVLLESLTRAPAAFEAIAEDLQRSFGDGPRAEPSDWIFAGSLLAGLRRAPLLDGYETLTRAGLGRTGPAGTALLSLGAELPTVLRHERLGYAVSCYGFRLAELGPAARSWLQRSFAPVRRGAAEVLADYRALFAHAARLPWRPRFLVLNLVGSSPAEEITNYAGLELDRVASVRAQELNLILHDLAREYPDSVAVIDADCLASELGVHAQLPDGIHQGGALQEALRREVLDRWREGRVRSG